MVSCGEIREPRCTHSERGPVESCEQSWEMLTNKLTFSTESSIVRVVQSPYHDGTCYSQRQADFSAVYSE